MNDNLTCELIADLLPLYQDGVCSEATAAAVETHLDGCASCRALAAQMKSSVLDTKMEEERNAVLGKHRKRVRMRSTTVGLITAGVLMIPVLVCLIVNLAVGRSLDWFFIVLSSLLLLASITVVPMMVPARKLVWSMLSGTASLVLLLLVCCVYTGGSWFWVASVPTVFGISLFLMPVLLYSFPLPAALQNKKGLISMVWDSLWLMLVVLLGTRYVGAGTAEGIEITLFSLVLAWSVFLVIRYLPAHPLTRAGIVTILCALFCVFSNVVINGILEGFRAANAWRYLADYDYVNLIVGICIAATGLILILIGALLKLRKR